MQIVSCYKVRIAESNQKIARAFIDTHNLYRAAVDFFIALILKHWEDAGTEADQGNGTAVYSDKEQA